MTEQMNAEQRRGVVEITDACGSTLPRLVPIMQWTIDETSGRPINHWMLAERLPSRSSSLMD